MDQAIVKWPGVKQFVAFRGTLQHGVRPSVFQLTIAPQKDPIEPKGDLVIEMGKEKITFKDCVVDSLSQQYDEGGFLVGLNILDRRWKWRFPTISGVYNKTDDAGEVLDGTGALDNVPAVQNSERTPKQLAKKCFEAMKEQGFSVAELPEDTRPKCNWDQDNAAQSLQSIAESCGCRVVLGLDNKARIFKLNKGKQLPDKPFVDAQLDIDPAEKPDKIRIVTAPTQSQIDWELEAVGLDTDGEWKKIDDLSYKPAAGWSSVDLEYFAALAAVTDPTVRQLALETVYRCYRIVLPKTAPSIGADGKIEQIELKRRDQVDLLSLQIDKDEIDGEKKKVRREAWVYGIWFVSDPKDWMDITEANGNSSTTHSYVTSKKDARLVTIGFSIDAELRMVRFTEQVYRATSTGTMGAAALRLRTACHLRKADTGGIVRCSFDTPTPGKPNKTEPMVDIHDDLEPTLIQKYRGSFTPDKTETNLEDIKPGAKAYAEHLVRELGLETPAAKKYPGILATEPDGALQAITWEVTDRGAYTTIQRNQDKGSRTAEPYAITRQRERRGALIDVAKKGLDLLGKGLKLIEKFKEPG